MITCMQQNIALT